MPLKQRLIAAEKIFRPQIKRSPVSIAFLDTGISPTADFISPENRIVAFLDLVNGRTEPYDDNGHGTHVTGTAKQTYENKKLHTAPKIIIRMASPYSWVCFANLRKQKRPFRFASDRNGLLLFL